MNENSQHSTTEPESVQQCVAITRLNANQKRDDLAVFVLRPAIDSW